MFFFYFPNTNKEEIKSIEQINQLLKQYERQLELISTNSLSVMVVGRTICESMTELLLRKEGYTNTVQATFYQKCDMIYRHNIIPYEVYHFLNLIRRYGNEAVHNAEPSNRLVLSFLKPFNYFIQWFDNYFSVNYQIKFPIERCCELISSLEYDDENKILFIGTDELPYLTHDNVLQLEELKVKQEINQLENEIAKKEKKLEKELISSEIKLKKDVFLESTDISQKSNAEYLLKEEIKRLNEELKLKEETNQKQIKELANQNKEILKKLDENGKPFERCMEIINEINERGKRVESKIDDLHVKIDNITNKISSIQSLTERQIKNAQSPEEIERIIGPYIDVCIENIMEYSMNFRENQNYQIEKSKLIYSIGEEGWNKLCEKSKTFLITSKVMYNHLITMDDINDYSGVCVLVTKALEVEIHKRFFTDFLDYLFERYGEDYKQYPTALLYQNRKPLLSEKFTMGNFVFVLCPAKNWNDTDEQKANNKRQLMKYCKDCIFSNNTEEEIEQLLSKYASSIEEIKDKYRNPSAHRNEIKRIDAEKCFNLILDIEKLLKQMLDSFDA